jgi:Zn-dependent protease with chaperone function
MPFLLLLFLTLVCLPERWDEPVAWFASPARSAALTWGGVVLAAAVARGVAASVCRLAADPERREAALRRYGKWRFRHVLVLLGLYTVSLYLFGWGWTVQRLAGHGPTELPGGELLILAPFLVSLILSWVCFYDAELALHQALGDDEPFWARTAYVGFHLRHNLALVFVPVLLLVVMKGLRRLWPEHDEHAAFIASLSGLALALSVFVGMPWVLRLVLGLTPLPDSPLRDRLEHTARRLGFRCSNILTWNTRCGVANAMVAGVMPWVRYVVLTDRLLQELTPEEIDAVFGHEIGHVKHHHMLYYLGFLMLSLALLWVMWSWVAQAVPFAGQVETALQALPLVVMLGTYIFLVFGFLSRRCERQADIYGCRAVSCPRPDCSGHDDDTPLAARGGSLCPTGIRTFIEALEKVARLNGISRDRPGWLQSWQHSTIARRVEFLQTILANPALERRFQRRVAAVKWALLLGLGAALVLLITLGWKQAQERETAHTRAAQVSSR